jgi:hypothetical protein
MTNQSPALVILYQATGPVPLPFLRCWVQIPRQLPVSAAARPLVRATLAAAVALVEGSFDEGVVDMAGDGGGLGGAGGGGGFREVK